jgi:hypothetical protein
LVLEEQFGFLKELIDEEVAIDRTCDLVGKLVDDVIEVEENKGDELEVLRLAEDEQKTLHDFGQRISK